MNEEKYFLIYKNQGETPLEALERARVEKGLDPYLSMTYAGRLDPMAEGLLLILVGDECKNKEKYLGLDKVYEVEVLLGFETDTGDLLGKLRIKNYESKNAKKEVVEKVLKSLTGKFVQEYPEFSSKTVLGKPLFALAKSGTLPETLPTKEVEIYSIKFLDVSKITAKELLEMTKERISKVSGDFRQEEILSLWQEELSQSEDVFGVMKIKVSCSSGTYMRSLAESIGEKLGYSALAFSIKRTKIGDFTL